MKNKIKKQIEYEDAPSGNVTFYNYKLPLMKFEKGFGFLGTLVFDTESEKIQCHMCGQWFGSLPHHIAREHGMTAADYKEYVGLNQSTALLSESARAKLIASGLEKRMRNLIPGKKKSKAQIEKIRKTLQKNTPEMQNLKGCCPEQLIQRLRNLYIENGNRTPRLHTLAMRDTLIKVYGSLKNACEVAGIPHRSPSTTITNERKKETRYVDTVEWVANFYDTHGRLPKSSDKWGMWVYIKKFGKNKVFAEALSKEGKFKAGMRLRYTKKQLIDFMKNFEKYHFRKPSTSDSKRMLLPHASRYIYHFGSWKKALKEAFN